MKTLIAAILAAAAVVALLAAGLATQWFGLAAPHYSGAEVRTCNALFARVKFDQQYARVAESNPGLSLADAGALLQSAVADANAGLRQMKRLSCPNGPYPLHAS